MSITLQPAPRRSSYRRGKRTNPTTDSGWATYNEGSRLFLPAATNYIPNPSVELDSDSDGAADGVVYWGLPVMTATLVPGRLGGLAQRIQAVNDTGATAPCYLAVNTPATSFAAGDSVSASAHCRLAGSGMGSSIFFAQRRDASSAGLGDAPATGLSGSDWTRYAVSVVCEATTDYVLLLFYLPVLDGGVLDFTVDDLCCTKSSILEPYFDGSMPDCSWSGAADASTSTRTVSALDVPAALGSTAFTIAGRITPIWAANDGLAHNICTLYAGADARVTIYKHTDNKLYCTVTDGVDSASSATAALSFAANSTHTFVARCTWASTVDLNLDGTDASQGDASAVAAQTIDSIVFDGGPTGYVGPVVLSPTEKAAAWVTAIQASSGAAFGDVGLLYDTHCSPSDVLIPLKTDGRAWVKR